MNTAGATKSFLSIMIQSSHNAKQSLQFANAINHFEKP